MWLGCNASYAALEAPKVFPEELFRHGRAASLERTLDEREVLWLGGISSKPEKLSAPLGSEVPLAS